MIESSSISLPPKFEPTSTNVGSEPVVMPLIRCSVVVGGSANVAEFNMDLVCDASLQWEATSLFLRAAAEEVLSTALLGPVVDDELEPMTDATTISPSPLMEALRDRAGSAPILMRHVGIFLFEPRDFGLHELVEFGQLLPAARAPLFCARAPRDRTVSNASHGRA